jgi:hypothetical protein
MKLVERANAIMLRPREEWRVIEREPVRPSELLIYVAVLAAIPEIANFIGQSLIGGYKPIVPSLLRAIIAYVVTLAMVYIIAGIIDLLAPKFGGKKNFGNAVKLSVYSHTPLWLAGIFLLVPGLNFLLILGLYGLYLLWVGLPLMGIPRYRAWRYAVIVTVCALVPAIVLAIV